MHRLKNVELDNFDKGVTMVLPPSKTYMYMLPHPSKFPPAPPPLPYRITVPTSINQDTFLRTKMWKLKPWKY